VRIGIDVIERRPGLAAVGATQETTDFHRDVNDVGIARMKCDAFSMSKMGLAGKSPLLDAGHLAESRQLRPALAEIVAVK
jgi:hypothetical protein